MIDFKNDNRGENSLYSCAVYTVMLVIIFVLLIITNGQAKNVNDGEEYKFEL